jgi:hypothetical protein
VRERGGADAVGRQARGSKEEEREGRKEEKRKEKKKGKKEKKRGKENRKREKKIKEGKLEKRKKKKGLGIWEDSRKILEEGGKWEFLRGSPVSGVNVIFGTAVMARRTGRRDRGVRGIPSVVADRGAGAARDGRQPECGRCRRDSRHARRG